MSEKTLYLAWESRQPRPAWYPVGRLDADVEESQYRFRYTGGAKRAQEVAGFPLLMEFRAPWKGAFLLWVRIPPNNCRFPVGSG